MDAYVLVTVIASLLGFIVFMYNLGLTSMEPQRKNTYRKMKESGYEIPCDPTSSECRPEEKTDTDIIIVGAGVAGAALAYTLGKDGRRVRAIERDLSKPDRIVGEVLQPGGYLKLMDLGLEDCVENIDAQRMVGYAIFKDGESVKLPYPLDMFGRSLHNGRFIQKMRDKADTLSNVQLTQGSVTSLLEENGTIKGVRYKTKGGDERKAYAPLTIVCDGCFSNLRRSLCYPKVDILSSFVGLVLRNCELPFENHGHVIMADPSPILFYRISSTEIRCLVDIPRRELPSLVGGEMAKYLKTVVAPQVPPELHDAFIFVVNSGNIRTMRNGSMPAAPCHKPGALLIGDAFNMRHALTGGGMTIALSDIVVLRNLLRNFTDLNDTHLLSKHLKSFYNLRKPTAFTLNTIAGVVYKVSCASADQARKEMHDVAFDYLRIAGFCAKGAASLLGGINPRPSNLLLHFSAVATYGVGRLLTPFPSPKRLSSVVRLISVISSIIFPIIKAEGVTGMFFPRLFPSPVI